MKYKKEIFIIFAVLFTVVVLFVDVTEKPTTSENEIAFDEWYYSVIDSAKVDLSFKRIPLDSKSEQRWFLDLMFKAWEKKITKDEFVKRGIKEFPDYKDSFKFIADNFL